MLEASIDAALKLLATSILRHRLYTFAHWHWPAGKSAHMIEVFQFDQKQYKDGFSSAVPLLLRE